MLSQHGSFFVEQRRCIWRPYAIVSLVLLITFLAWDSTAWDMYLESIWGEPSGFSLRDQWWMAKIMHEGAHNLGWGGVIGHSCWHLASLGCTQNLGHIRSSQFVFIRVERAVVCDFDQRFEPNKLSMGPPGFWRGNALRVSLEPMGCRWRWRSLLPGRSRLHRLRLHGRLLWASTKQCAGCNEVVACRTLRRICFRNFTTNARRALHESHPLDSLVVLDGGLDQPPDFSLAWSEKKSGSCIMKPKAK